MALGLVGASACSGSTSAVAAASDGGASDGPRSSEGGTRPDGSISCSTNNDCGSTFLTCSPGGVQSGCGICIAPQNPCKVDSDCMLIHDAAPSKPMICGPLGPCTCPQGGATGDCIPACQGPSDCGADGACDMPSGRCVAKPCTSDADCPSTQYLDYACSPTGTCAAKACKVNADCGADFCVNGTCYPQQGVCIPPAA